MATSGKRHGRASRSWRSYLFEFFLIFLSVSVSFLVDNYRDDLADRRRARVYAGNMIADLASDTIRLAEEIAKLQAATDNVSTFLSIVGREGGDRPGTGELYWYGLWCGFHHGFVSNDATYRAMTASGNLELFDYEAVGRYVGEYYKGIEDIRSATREDQAIYAQTRAIHARLFDFRFNQAANAIVQANRQSFSQARVDSFRQTRPPLLSRDPALMSEYAEMCRSRNFGSRLNSFRDAFDNADTAIAKLNSMRR